MVSDVESLTPQLTRVVFTGDLDNWKAATPGGHFKLFVPQPGEDEPAMRTYTVRACDPDNGRLTVDFALHAGGPATAWAKSAAAAGQELQISGVSRSGYAPGEGAAWTVFLADHAALPAVAAITEALPAGHPTRVLVEIPADSERIELPSDATLEVEWLLASGEPCAPLVDGARALELPEGGGEVWVGCEAGAMREIRAHLLHERGLSHGALHTRSYWKRDVVNHPDHDFGDDVD